MGLQPEHEERVPLVHAIPRNLKGGCPQLGPATATSAVGLHRPPGLAQTVERYTHASDGAL